MKTNRDDNEEARGVLLESVGKLLVPAIRILLRFGVPYKAFQDLAKRVYVRVSVEEFRIPRRKPSASRVSILTGLPRKEVASLLASPEEPEALSINPVTPAARIIAAWRRDPAFTDARGRPASLVFEGRSRSFSDLVKHNGNDVTPRAALDELVRVGAVERTRDDRLRLVARAYVPAATDLDTITMLGTHVPLLICSIEHNLKSAQADAYFQRKVEYDNIPVDAAGRLRSVVGREAQAVLEKLDRALSKQDRDVNPKVEGKGRRRIVLGIYYFEDDVEES